VTSLQRYALGRRMPLLTSGVSRAASAPVIVYPTSRLPFALRRSPLS